MIRSSSGASCSIRFAPSAMAFLHLQSVRRHGWTGKGLPPTPHLPPWQYAFRKDQAMPTRSFDVVILGGGNAGMGVTVATREARHTVAMIEPDLLGGACPNRGCIPKKVLVAAAQ